MHRPQLPQQGCAFEDLNKHTSIVGYVLQAARLSLEHEHSQQQQSDADEWLTISYEASSGEPPQQSALSGHGHIQILVQMQHRDVHQALLSWQVDSLLSLMACSLYIAGRSMHTTCRQWIDIDAADIENSVACTDYMESIMDHLFQAEVCPGTAQTSCSRREKCMPFFDEQQGGVHVLLSLLMISYDHQP